MSEPHPIIPTRAPATTSVDDTVLPFQVEALDLRGRVVRFGPAIDTILSRHRYPEPVAKLVGEAIVLTVLLGSTLRSRGGPSIEVLRLRRSLVHLQGVKYVG